MSEIEELTHLIREFAKRRDWERFHSPKNLAMAITGEAGELAAEFQWLSTEEASRASNLPVQSIELEIADVAIYILRLCDVLNLNLAEAIKKKIELNESRFPPLK
jgi:NTP pyrophosphatase (non-canonical NTP hydrolase)